MVDMDNYRGENTLAFFRKLFTTLLYEKLDELAKVFEGLMGLSSKHVAMYLFWGAGNAYRAVY